MDPAKSYRTCQGTLSEYMEPANPVVNSINPLNITLERHRRLLFWYMEP